MSFRDKILSGKFTITAEISPPKGTDMKFMLHEADLVKDVTDAINITDNQRAIMRMSPLAASCILSQRGYEIIMHLTCRDRNRLSLQSELLGASASGINNILVMSGDHPMKGDHEGAKPVYDLDSVTLLGLIGRMNEGFDLSGNQLDGKTDFFPGAVSNISINEIGLIKLSKKIKMRARFIQTQAVFDIDIFSEFIEKLRSVDSFGKVKIIAGVIPLKSEKTARFLSCNVPGIRVPEKIMKRMEDAKDKEICGMEIASDLIRGLRELCDGVHMMPVGSHKNTPRILEMAGI